MATEEWQEIARKYSLLSEEARADYWRQLTPDQQESLRDTLAIAPLGATASDATRGQPPTRARRGCGSPVAAGCIGMILGCILTIGAEVAAVMMGAHAVSDVFSGTSSRGTVSSGTSQPNDSESGDCSEIGYHNAHLYKCDPAQWRMEDRKAHHPEEFGFPPEQPH